MRSSEFLTGLRRRVVRALAQEGAWVDYWTIVHTVVGALLGGVSRALGVRLVLAFLATLILLTLFEVLEPILYRRFGKYFPYGLGKGSRFPETAGNQFMDIVSGLVGFLVPYLL